MGFKKFTTEKFIELSRERFGNKYDYSKTIYTKHQANVIIICPEHGEFEVNACNHLRSKTGCKFCSRLNMSIPNKILKPESKQKIIENCKLIHNGKYDYSKTKIGKIKDKVTIICPEHGEFKQNIRFHEKGTGCPKCFRVKNAKEKTLSNETFIKKCKEKYGDKYDYSKTNYVKSRDNVTIICREHGEFEIKAIYFLHNNSGCPKCSNRKIKQKTDNSKTKIKRKFKNFLKVDINEKTTTKEYIKLCEKKYGDKYDYSKTVFIKPHYPVTITCPQHGDFKKIAILFIKSVKNVSCPKCLLNDKYIE